MGSETMYTINTKVATVDPYEKLANAIIIKAADDYEVALSNDDTNKIVSLEKFFRGEWYRALTRVDGNYIISKIRHKLGK